MKSEAIPGLKRKNFLVFAIASMALVLLVAGWMLGVFDSSLESILKGRIILIIEKPRHRADAREKWVLISGSASNKAKDFDSRDYDAEDGDGG